MSSKILTLGLAVLVAGAVSASAQGRGRGQQGRTAQIRFQGMDRNNDGVITREEWRGSAQSFKVHDWNGDGKLSGNEVRVGASRNDRAPNTDNFDYSEREYVFDDWTDRGFRALDYNRDNRITRDEWHGSPTRFAMLDINHDGRLSLQEFQQTATLTPTRSAAYRAGYERGLIEGRQAGREERLNNRAWDLEGQTELEQADSGYQPGMGPRADYQAGYREAFRRAYREGWDHWRSD